MYLKHHKKKFMPMPSFSRSPLNLGEDGPNLYLNFWNLNQTFFLKGKTYRTRFQNLLNILAKRCPHAIISEVEEAMGVEALSNSQIAEEIRTQRTRGYGFQTMLNSMRMQLRYSFVALLSENCVSLFNPSLHELMLQILNNKWNDSEHTANFSAFLLDKMHFELDPVARPYENLPDVFKRLRKNPDIVDEYHEVFDGSVNYMRQHRISVSPTLTRVSRGEEEETNRVIRKFAKHMPCFVRLNFVTETGDRGHYFGSIGHMLLGFIHRVMQNGVYLGNRRLSFLSYSNSQLKNHSCWLLCRDDPYHTISEAQIEAFMGSFSHENNFLKRQARRGQCFSTSKKICELQPDQVMFGLDDIVRNGFTFSDGVGYISAELAKQAAEQFRFSQVSAL